MALDLSLQNFKIVSLPSLEISRKQLANEYYGLFKNRLSYLHLFVLGRYIICVLAKAQIFYDLNPFLVALIAAYDRSCHCSGPGTASVFIFRPLPRSALQLRISTCQGK